MGQLELKPGGRTVCIEARWEDGVYLGLSDRADEVRIHRLERRECRQSYRTIKRREATVRHDLPFLQRLTARPWDPPRSGCPGDGELGPRPLAVVPPLAPPGGEQPKHRRV